jgi:hypothetical protein
MRIFLASILISLFAYRDVGSQCLLHKSPREATLRKPLVIRVGALKQKYLLGTPVQLRVTAVNRSDSQIRTRLFLEPQYGDVTLYISKDGKTFVPYLGPDWELVEIEGTVTLNSWEEREAVFSVLWNNDVHATAIGDSDFLAFPAPGIYLVKLQVLTGVGTIESNAIKIELLAPADVDERIWDQIKADSRLIRFIQDPRPDEKDARIMEERLGVLIKTYPDSTYAIEFKKTLHDYRQRSEEMERVRRLNADQK